jgi:hypothetical protein
VILDYDDNRNEVGMEILHLGKRVPAEMIKRLQFEKAYFIRGVFRISDRFGQQWGSYKRG